MKYILLRRVVVSSHGTVLMVLANAHKSANEKAGTIVPGTVIDGVDVSPRPRNATTRLSSESERFGVLIPSLKKTRAGQESKTLEK